MTPNALRFRKARLASAWRQLPAHMIQSAHRYVDRIIIARRVKPAPTIERVIEAMTKLTEAEFVQLQGELRMFRETMRVIAAVRPPDPEHRAIVGLLTGHRAPVDIDRA